VLALGAQGVTARLVGLNASLKDLPQVLMTEAEAGRVRHGGVVEVPGELTGLHRVLEPSGALLAVADVVRGRLAYRRVFLPDPGSK
jgi:tRNA pseudouridine55 synthase